MSFRETLDAEAAELPSHLLDLLAVLPANVDRRTGADLIRKHFFTVSHRSLEAWPLPWRHVNGRAHTSTAALFARAYEKLSSAPVVMGGRQSHKAVA